MVPKFSRKPEDWLAAMPKARAHTATSAPYNLMAAAAAANTPQVPVE